MASLDTKKALSNFLKKGFILNESHHHYYEFWHDGKLIAQTYASHSGKTLDDYLISAMRKQCKMEKNFFIEFAKCTRSQAEYVLILESNGFL